MAAKKGPGRRPNYVSPRFQSTDPTYNMNFQRSTKNCLAVYNMDDPEGALLRDAERKTLARSLPKSDGSCTSEMLQTHRMLSQTTAVVAHDEP